MTVGNMHVSVHLRGARSGEKREGARSDAGGDGRRRSWGESGEEAASTGRGGASGAAPPLKGPQRRPQKPLDRRLKEVAKAVESGYCWLQMPFKLALGIRETVAGHSLGALAPLFPIHPSGGHAGCCSVLVGPDNRGVRGHGGKGGTQGIRRSGVDPPLCPSRACLPMDFTASSVQSRNALSAAACQWLHLLGSAGEPQRGRFCTAQAQRPTVS